MQSELSLIEPALRVFAMGPQLINNGCVVMMNLGKPLRDSERYPRAWQQADGLTEEMSLEAGRALGLLRVTLAEPSPTQIIPLPPIALPHLLPRSLPGDSH